MIFANGAVESVFGWKPEELIGKSIRVLYTSQEDFEKIGKKGYAVLEKKRNFMEPEFPCRRKDGATIVCRINAARIGSVLRDKRIVVTYEDITEQKKAEESLRDRTKELEIQTRNLEDINTTLNVLLKKREDDKKKLEENVLLNFKESVVPSPFLRTISSKFLKLTPKELVVASLVKEGKATKEIAQLLNTSIRGIEFHRESLRTKLGLKNKKKNLRAYLLSMPSDE
ncbi:MAG: PAS domain S-box protein [Syntrophales bacterium]